MYTTEYGLAGTAIALLSLLSLPLYTHLRTSIIPWSRPVLDNHVGGLAKRVVVIVSDGLRADQELDKFANGLNYKDIVKTTSWVEAPTESRPAHGQFLCGVDEDPQALFEQWTRFPRTPDNVLRNAQFAVAIGAPDVVPYFGGRNVHMETYKDAVLFAQGAALNIVNAIDDYYKDRDTAFIFLSDHGFGSSRTHDQAEASSRKTPLWLFGKGFNATNIGDQYTTNHKDLSLLISILVGNPLPTDSIGAVPVHLLPHISDYFKANAILLACQSSLIRMRMVYEQWVERGDRLLSWSATRKDIDTMSRNFEQLQMIIENKPELAKDVVGMSQAAHRDILGKTESLIYRNAGIALALAMATVLMAAVSMWTVGYQNVKGSGESGAFSYLSLLVATVVSGGLVMRGAEWPYYVWCWAAAVVFAMNGAVMAVDFDQVVKRESLAVWAVTVLTASSLFFHPINFLGLLAFSLYTIVVCKREQKRSMYGLLALLMTAVLAFLPFIPPKLDIALLSTIVKAVALAVSAAVTKSSFGELTVGQVALCAVGVGADYFNFSTIVRVVLLLSLIAHNLDNSNTTLRWFWTSMTVVCSCGSAINVVTLLAVSIGAVLLTRVHLQEHLGDVKFEPFISSTPSLFIMAAFIANGGLLAVFSPAATHLKHVWNVSAFGVVLSCLMTALPSVIVITAVKSGHANHTDKEQHAHGDSQFRLAAAMMLPFALAALASLMALGVKDATWRQIGESIGRFEFSIISCAMIFLTGYL